jgi:hypothetical protein
MTPITRIEQLRDAADHGQCLLLRGTLFPAKAVYYRHSLIELCQMIAAGALLLFDRRERGAQSC